ncbi:hypothetical protein [Haloarcula marismortui]|uniref:Uncharacterized protein n=1 Tax=Haloarcula marismortui ATCC 33799 TaxID=662475 RepID=M0JVK7_9EURY|nr:hypothetical protein [Haloarcula californiae]EMA12428.1 hypothetical protein C435_17237 [Haloarcula californiae ATCC 33799]
MTYAIPVPAPTSFARWLYSGRSAIERSLDATVEYASLIWERAAADTRSVKIPPVAP